LDFNFFVDFHLKFLTQSKASTLYSTRAFKLC
jgi:hypothetical protein